jgi:ornithine cyclodeaminase/alanine dehydrogenase-like protein (mu-crystallin family)
VGATKPQRCEIDPLVVARASAVVADSVSGSRVECGDLIRAADAGLFDWERLVSLDTLVVDPGRLPRAGEAGPALFETQGVAAQDVATASLVWELVREL